VPDAGDALPDEVRRLLAERIESIAQLEVLLLLHRTAPMEWGAEAVSRELRIETGWAAELLALLQRADLVAASGADSRLYRFQPAGIELGKAVESLAASYADRRVSVVAQLYSRPVDRIRVLADAFRIRKEDSDG
jgi:hypothetical protein